MSHIHYKKKHINEKGGKIKINVIKLVNLGNKNDTFREVLGLQIRWIKGDFKMTFVTISYILQKYQHI